MNKSILTLAALIVAAPAGTRRDRAVRLAVYATDLTATLNGDGHDRHTDSDCLPPRLAAP